MEYITYILLLGIAKYTCAEYFEVSDIPNSWYSARNDCTLAVPNLSFEDDTISVSLKKKADELWVGYVEAFQTFKYIGCIQIDQHSADHNTGKDVGRCFSACNTNIIGMQHKETECFCFDHYIKDVQLQSGCDRKCDNPGHTACGNSDKGLISIYERVLEESDGDAGQNCKSRNMLTSTERWENCKDMKHPFYCLNNGVSRLIKKKEEWLMATEKCFNKNASLSVPANVSVDTKVWTPKIRSKTIIEYKMGKTDGKCGYVNKDYNLKFDDCKKERAYLCQKVISTSTTPTTKDALSSAETSVSNVMSKSSTPTTEAVTSSAGTSMSVTSTKQKSHKHSGKNKTVDNGTSSDVYIGISVAFVTFIAIGVGLFLFWKKRKQSAARNDKKRRKRIFSNKSYDPTAACSAPEETMENYDEIVDINSYHSKVNPSKEYKEAVDDEYNNTVSSRKTGNQEFPKTENVYNKLDLPDDTYDHTGTCHEFTSGRPTSNVYGLSSDGPTENQYGIPDVVSSEDTYNHVNEA